MAYISARALFGATGDDGWVFDKENREGTEWTGEQAYHRPLRPDKIRPSDLEETACGTNYRV